MKRIVITLVSAALVSAAAFGVDFSVGVRGIFDINCGTTVDGSADNIGCTVGGGHGLYGKIDFELAENFYLGGQVEFNSNFGNGYSVEIGNETHYVSAHSMDIPILLTMSGKTSGHATNMLFGAGVGFNFSLPFSGSPINSNYVDLQNVELTKFVPGLVFDLNHGFLLGKNERHCITTNIRYYLDLAPTEIKTSGVSKELYTRRALQIGLGYEYRF